MYMTAFMYIMAPDEHKVNAEAGGRRHPGAGRLLAVCAKVGQVPRRHPGGNDFIPDFRGSVRTHFVATTVELLTTGVDVRPVRNVVFFKYVGSPIAFYQMLGRGTRIDEFTGKLVFTIYDYTGATRLLGESFVTNPTRERGAFAEGEGPDPSLPPPRLPRRRSGSKASPPSSTTWGDS